MKKTLLLSISLYAALFAKAQAPALMNYQSVVRNAQGQPVTNTLVNFKFRIHQGTLNGSVAFTETDTVTTNQFGLATVQIGSGSNLGAVSWGTVNQYLQVGVDITGDTNFIDMGTTQLLSVPYALFAGNGVGPGGDSVASFLTAGGGIAISHDTIMVVKHYIGENYGGGIVFCVDSTGQHGLIAATTDQSATMRWFAGSYSNTMAYAGGTIANANFNTGTASGTSSTGAWGGGKTNTALIIASQGYGDGATYAARICNEYSMTVGGQIYEDWYLPSIDELNLMYLNIGQGNALHLGNVGGFTSGLYGCSTEHNSASAWYENFDNGYQYIFDKSSAFHVRAVRGF